MGLFEQLGNNKGQNQTTPQEALQQLRADPGNALRRSGFSAPDGLNDPHKIVDHLLQSGQVSNSNIQLARRIMSAMGYK